MVSGLFAKHHEGDDLRDFGAKLKQAVQEGKLSKEDAMAKWKAAAQKMKGEHHGKGGHEDHKSKMMEAIKRAVEQGKLSEREAKAKWMAIRGEHGGDPASIDFCEKAKLNYVSCSPYRVPIARLAAAQAYLKKKK